MWNKIFNEVEVESSAGQLDPRVETETADAEFHLDSKILVTFVLLWDNVRVKCSS